MIFIFLYYFFNLLISNFLKYFYFNSILKKTYFYIIKVIDYFLYFLSVFRVIPIFLFKLIVWIILGYIIIQFIFKINLMFSFFFSYIFNFKIKYQLFIFTDYKFDSYSVIKILDFIFFYPILYLYFFFFNDLTFSFQRAYYWILYKVNSFGMSQNRRSRFFRYWSYGPEKFVQKYRYERGVYNFMSTFFRKSMKSAVEKFPFVGNFHYYLFFLLIIVIFLFLIYKVYFKDLKPIKYDMDDSIRFDFFGSLSDQTFRFEFNEYLTERIENKIFKLKRYPLDYIYKNQESLSSNEDYYAEEKNSFDLLMNKYGIDGLAYLDEIRNNSKNSSKYTFFNYFFYFFYFLKDLLDIFLVLLKYQFKFNYNFLNKINIIHYVKINKKNYVFSKIEFIYFFSYFFFFIIFYLYIFVIVVFVVFFLLDAELFSMFSLFYISPYGVDLKNLLLYLT